MTDNQYQDFLFLFFIFCHLSDFVNVCQASVHKHSENYSNLHISGQNSISVY